MTHEWITHRLPTEADGDDDGDVRVPDGVDTKPPGGFYQHYAVVVPGQPWWSHRIPERDEVEPVAALVVAVGQQWRRRNGEVVTITRLDPDTDLPILVDGKCWHRADGASCLGLTDDDLIELVSAPEPAPAPARKVNRFEAVGGYLYALCDDGSMWRLASSGWTQLPAIPQPEA
jgi:hypothetical protein